jgi:hypothetical protein
VQGAAAHVVAISGEFPRHDFKADVVDPYWFVADPDPYSVWFRIRIQGANRMRIHVDLNPDPGHGQALPSQKVEFFYL